MVRGGDLYDYDQEASTRWWHRVRHGQLTLAGKRVLLDTRNAWVPGSMQPSVRVSMVKLRSIVAIHGLAGKSGSHIEASFAQWTVGRTI